MIKNAETLASIRESWRTVRTLEGMIRTNTNSGAIFTLIPAATGFANIPESLLLLFAMSVLEDALRQLRDEEVFNCSRNELKQLMDASHGQLRWLNFDAVNVIRDRRNRVAHRREFLSPGQYKADIATIAQELLSWGVLDEDAKIDAALSSSPHRRRRPTMPCTRPSNSGEGRRWTSQTD